MPKIIFFSDYGHVEYQNKGNGAINTMQAHIMSLHTPSAPGVASTGQNNKHHASTHNVITHTLGPCGSVYGSK